MSLLAIFPLVISSMLVEGSLVAPISGTVLKTLRTHGDGWVVLCGISFFIFLLLTMGVVFVEMGIQSGNGTILFILSAMAAVLFVSLLILYFRVLGRLMWYTQNVRKKVEES